MSNLHGTQQLTTTLVTTAETVVASLGPYAVNQGIAGGGAGDLRGLQPATPPGAQGTMLSAYITGTLGTGATSVTLRVRLNSLTGTILPSALNIGAAAGGFIASPGWFDPTVNYPFGILYVLTAQVAGASANSSINAIFTAEGCNSFE